MNPASANFQPRAGNGDMNGTRPSPYPAATTAGCTYANPMIKMEATVQRLQTDLTTQRTASSQELERVKRELEETKKSMVTRESLNEERLGMVLEAIDMKDEIRKNRENLTVVRDTARQDFRTMYQILMNLQSKTAGIESQKKSMLAVMQGQAQGQVQRPALEAASPVKMIEAESAEEGTAAVAKPEQGLERSSLSKQAEVAGAQAPTDVKEFNSSGLDAEATNDSTALVKTSSSTAAAPKAWLPFPIRGLKPSEVSTPSSHVYTFSDQYLQEHLGGSQISPGLFFSDPTSALHGGAYWLLEAVYEPFAPVTPGAHGAKLTPFFNKDVDSDTCINIPVFVSTGKPGDYTYMGQYSQPRYSDKLSHSEMMDHVPARVLRYWTENLAAEQRPEWLIAQLMEHIAPSSLSAHDCGVAKRAWEQEARAQVEALDEAYIAGLWARADADQPKGLRLWWEYLQCVGYDRNFYQKLVELGIPDLGGEVNDEKVSKAKDVATVSETPGQQQEKPIQAKRVEGLEKDEKLKATTTAHPDHAVQQPKKQVEERAQAEDATQKQQEAEDQTKQDNADSAPFSYEASFTPRKKRN